jgi:probable HAF family extracellular repeat protein
MGKGAARWWHALWLVWMVVERLTWLGTLGGNSSWAWGVSADGSVVVGMAVNAAGKGRAFRWTAARGMQDLGTLPGGDESWADAVSADGSVVVGISGGRAFRWTAARGMQDLGTLGGDWSWAHGVSADGSVVVGEAYNAAGQRRAFRWTAARGMRSLGMLPGGGESVALGVSADGSVVVGTAGNAEGWGHAFRWTAAGGHGGPEHHLRPPADRRLGTLGSVRCLPRWALYCGAGL